MTEDSREVLRRTLANLCGRRSCVLAGRATSALTATLRAADLEGDRVLVPDILCPSPASAALYAEMVPVFCDIDPRDGNASAKSVERILRKRDDVGAVLVAHLYGHPAAMGRFEALTDEHDVLLIEDAAQSLGGTLNGRPLGSFGGVSLLSFGNSKIVDAGPGGAALTDDDGLAEAIRSECRSLPAYDEDLAPLMEEYRDVYYTLRDLTRKNPDLHRLYLQLPEVYRRMYLFDFEPSWASAILEGLSRLDESVGSRREKGEVYSSHLDHPAIRALDPREGVVPWRHSFLVRAELQREFSEELRAKGVDVSNWYPALHRWYRSGRCQEEANLAGAIEFEDRIVNLWLDETVGTEEIPAICEAVHATLDECLANCGGAR